MFTIIGTVIIGYIAKNILEKKLIEQETIMQEANKKKDLESHQYLLKSV